ncbi:MAG: threonine--tRNA ligase [Planctomycetota bacterium]
MAKVILPDGSVFEVAAGTTLAKVVQQIDPDLVGDAIAAKINGQLVDLSAPVNHDVSLTVITAEDEQGLDIIRHSCAHIMAEAICSIWPDAELVYGPTVKDGFYYDIDLNETISPEDFPNIEQKMQEIIAADKPFIRTEISRDQALLHVAGNKYKVDNINRAMGDIITFYSHGQGFKDLCRGPHVPSTGKIAAFRIMSVAGAYWHGDPTQKMLQRVYGTAWPGEDELNTYLTRLEEARKRDHRVLGKQLDLFSFHDEGPGFAFFHPKGMIIWNAVIDYWRSIHTKYGYEEIKTPIILDEQLWHQSGHWDNYKENMYFTTVDENRYAVKPMNCPGGCLVYKARPHSYREFPMRIAELGLVHRYEASGVMHGLVRVRQFTQDDAHIFCTPQQIQDEIIGVIELVFEMYEAFGFDVFHIELSTKPEKHIGSDEIWDISTDALKAALAEKKIEYKTNEGDGAFYGPKIDFHVFDCLERSWQLGTIQLDFSMPQRFGLVYTDSDNREKTPVMIHRAILGSLERFIGILIEHYGGWMPLWLAPEQMRILPISDKTADYARRLLKQLKMSGFRCTADMSGEKIGAKIARAHSEKVPYLLVVGPKEARADELSITIHTSEGDKKELIKADRFIELVNEKIDSRSLDWMFA